MCAHHYLQDIYLQFTIYSQLLKEILENEINLNVIIDKSRKMINKKHIDYNKDDILKSNVNNLISNIYDERKNKATQIFNIKSPILDNIVRIDKIYFNYYFL